MLHRNSDTILAFWTVYKLKEQSNHILLSTNDLINIKSFGLRATGLLLIYKPASYLINARPHSDANEPGP